MTVLDTLRNLYRPVQPSVDQENRLITYKETAPPPSVKHLVYCFWQLRTNEKLASPYVYRVVADGCIDMFFDVNKPRDARIMGFCTQFTEFEVGRDFNYIGIRFFPSIFPQIFHVNAKKLSNKTSKLSDVAPSFANHISGCVPAGKTLLEVSNSLSSFLETILMDRAFSIDLRFYEAIKIILQARGSVEIEADLKTGLSDRQLRRVFNYYIGTTAKSFSKVVRFQFVLSRWREISMETDHKVFYEAGFYDQAHFIKDFKNYYGIKPSVALR